MSEALGNYLTQRPDGGLFLLQSEMKRSLVDLFPKAESLLPRPYKIFFADESQLPVVGFPVAQSPVMADLDAKLDRWLSEEVAWQLSRSASKDRVQAAFNAYVGLTIKLAENAMVSTLLADYHGVFWLAHSFDLGKHFTSLPRRVGAVDAAAGRQQGDAIKYRIFAKWAHEMREQMARLATRVRPVLDGEEERGLQFFRTLQDNVLIFTEEFIGPDLRELRPFMGGYLQRDFHLFRESFDRMQAIATDLLKRDPIFRNSVRAFGVEPEQGLPLGLLLNRRFQKFLFEIPATEAAIGREEREQIQSISRRLGEFSILNQLRRGITWTTTTPEGDIVPVDRRSTLYSRSTRPIDFGRAGVVDPMVHRFGLMYDIAAFSETLGKIAKGGVKGELNSYRQMLLFQRRLEGIADRHRLQFEKFLGDGAFYTTRRALRLVRGAIEVQRFYSETRTKGFAFNKGMRIALNFGYYRLLPMKGSPDSTERVMEFYGPGIVELSRLTTGKATKEIEEIQGFLISHGYESAKVAQFFAPLARGVDTVDHQMHQREFFAYVNSSGHLMNEGIVGSMAVVKELSAELTEDGNQLHRLRCKWGTYVGFEPGIAGVEYVGLRILGNVSLKGLDKVEICEVVPMNIGEVEASPLDRGETLLSALRQIYHEVEPQSVQLDADDTKTRERQIESPLVLCVVESAPNGGLIVMGHWDPSADQLTQSIRIHGNDLEFAGIRGPLNKESLDRQLGSLKDLYLKVCESGESDSVRLETFRREGQIFVLGEKVEQL